jgi:diguanylate cyclase (GGDEF)-like protein/PAS domain S-box-containing protein
MPRHDPGSLDEAVGAGRLFAVAPEALLVVRDGIATQANEAAVELVGRDPTGGSIDDLLPGWAAHAGSEAPFEDVLARGSGSPALPVEVRVRQLDGGVALASVRDARRLVAGRDAAVALTEAEARYRSLVEQIPAIVYSDDGTRTTYVSPQIEEILGVSAEAYRDDPDMWLSLVHPDDRAIVEAQSEAFIRGDGGDLADYRMVRPDGRIVWVRDRAYAFRDDDGTVLWEHGLLFDVTELKEAEARVAHLAYHDSLTGLANRQLFEETLSFAMERARRAHQVVAVLYFDLDNFKLVNDSLGHHTGDALLVQLAERLRACTRDADLVARQGGDEFLMLLGDLAPDTADPIVRRVAGRIEEAMSRPFDLHGRRFHARGSSGISMFPRDAADAETMLRNADIAMYRAKRSSPGGHIFYAADIDEATDRPPGG